MVKMIQNYTLLQIIGEGNYGKVYRGKNIKSNKQFAIKIIPSQKLHQNPKLQQCTMNQIQTLNLIGQTQHIIMYYQMLKTKNNYYFVYEYCNGGTLMDLLQKQIKLNEQKAIQIFKQLLEAFKVLNKLNIMHRDLKPENIFFADNKVKLGDFGFCKGLRPEENMTKTMLGSPIYMAPEVLKGQSYSTKADIWSLGVILYEMLYGVCPFQSSSIAMLISTINQSTQINLPSSIKISQKTQLLIKKLLTKDYFRRISWIQLFSWFSVKSVKQLKTNVIISELNSNNNNDHDIENSIELIKQKCLNINNNNNSNNNNYNNNNNNNYNNQHQHEYEHEKQNVFKLKTSLLEQPAPNQLIIEQWLSNKDKKLLDFNSYKQRSVSQDFSNNNSKRAMKYEFGSIQNISPSNSINVHKLSTNNSNNGYFLKRLDDDEHSRQGINLYNHDNYENYQRNYENLHQNKQPKPSSLTKNYNKHMNSYGYNSAYKPQSKKVFYSQNYQNIFSTPMNDKNKTLGFTDKDNNNKDKQISNSMNTRRNRLTEQKDRNQNLNKNNLTPSNINKPNLHIGNPAQQAYLKHLPIHNNTNLSINLQYPSSSCQLISSSKLNCSTNRPYKSLKRQKLLQIHQQCSLMLNCTYSLLSQQRQQYLTSSFILIKFIINRLKRLTGDILINEIDLLDISSLVNYEIIQLQRMQIEIKDQMNLFHIKIPENCIKQQINLITNELSLLDNPSDMVIIKEFVSRHLQQYKQWDLLSRFTQKIDELSNRNMQKYVQDKYVIQKNICIQKNTSIIDMLHKMNQQNNIIDRQKQLTQGVGVRITSPLNLNSPSQRYMKSHYHTTNSFAEYYKNLIQTKDKNTSNSKISIK